MKKYDIIYADPPWSYNVWKGKKSRTSDSHYNVLTLKEIKNLNINLIANKDCALFMWVTPPQLQHAFDVITKWNFNYKTVAFTWVKKNKKSDSLFFGLGHWTRSNAELCLLATKGKPKRINKSVSQIILSRIEQHSKKPDEARNRIVELMGDLPRIELFARQKTSGWDVMGDHIDGKDIKKLLIK
tara:strand:+ start:13132 stop:13686 length:555 start_codon:yes stop_codon:yes gene_type:complete